MAERHDDGSLKALADTVETFRMVAYSLPAGHPDRPAGLSNLAAALLDWYGRTGDQGAADEALTCAEEAVRRTPDGHPGAAGRLHNLSLALRFRFRSDSDPATLTSAITAERLALKAAGGDHPQRAIMLGSLGHAQWDRYRDSLDEDALAEAIDCFLEALGGMPEDHEDRPSILDSLGNCLQQQFALTGELQVIDDAIYAYLEALRSAASFPGFDWPGVLYNLSLAQRARLRATGDPTSLEEAIACLQRAVVLSDNADARSLTYLGDLGKLLFERFDATGKEKLLDDAISTWREALHRAPEGDARRTSWLTNLGAGLLERFAARQNRDDLERAIALHREAVGHLSEDDPSGNAASLSDLGNALVVAYETDGQREHLAEALAAYRRAVDLSKGSARRADILNNLASGLKRLYECTGDAQALEEAVDLYRRAVREGGGGPHHATLLASLGAALAYRYERTRDAEDLEQMLASLREAVAQADAADPRRPTVLDTLCAGLLACYPDLRDPALLQEAIGAAEDALRLTPEGHARVPEILHNLTTALRYAFLLTREREFLSQGVDAARKAVHAQEALIRAGQVLPSFLIRLRYQLALMLMFRGMEDDWEGAEEQLSLLLEQQETELGRQMGERAALDYLRHRERIYHLAVRCRLGLVQKHTEKGDAEGAARLRESAWYAAEQGKGRLFSAILASERTALAPTRPVLDALRRIEDLGAQLERIAREEEEPSWDADVPRPSAMRRWRQLRAAYRTAVEELETLDPELASLTAAKALPVADVMASLPPGGVLLEFYPLEGHTAIFAIDRKGLRTVACPLDLETLTDWTRALDEAMQQGAAMEEASALVPLLDEMARYMTEALDHLLGPSDPASASQEVGQLLIVPTGPLHRWPLHLLPWRGGILWDAFAISYLPTADTLVYCTARRPEGTDAPILLAPDPSLPGSFAEAALAAASGWKVALRESATAERLRGAWQGIALATHAEADPSSGAASRVLLWTGSAPGWVSALELLRQMRGRPAAEHGQLGTCAAHYEEVAEGDHLQGLTRAFLAAGLRSLTTTLWPLDDMAACFVGERLRELAALAPLRSKASCLRQAALELRDGGWAHAGRWLSQRPRASGADALVLAVSAVLCLRGGDADGFSRLWAAAREASSAETDEYGSARAALTDYDAVYRIIANITPGQREQFTQPMLAAHWGAPVLIGQPLPSRAAAPRM